LFRATNAKLLNPDGTGLGLYISKSFLERLGGSISFVSEPGEETVFTIRVPREPKLQQQN
ncbi:MAG: ATP-binding protein, partial [Rectinemataceae bacterium]|nr:ATP-binding protein [Rectinemataceae bacterium]